MKKSHVYCKSDFDGASLIINVVFFCCGFLCENFGKMTSALHCKENKV